MGPSSRGEQLPERSEHTGKRASRKRGVRLADMLKISWRNGPWFLAVLLGM